MANGATENVASAVRGSPQPADPAEVTSRDANPPKTQSWKSQYARALRWCGAAALIGWGSQHMLDAAGVAPTTIPKLVLAVGVGLAVFAFVAVRKNPRRIGDLLVSNPLIVSVLSLITLATIAGTLIPQRINPAAFDKAYGSAAGFMRALFLDDLFHSLWLYGLVALTATALMAIAVKRWPWTFPKWGYVAAHLGPVVILLGALFGQIGGAKGRVDLEVGRSADQMVTHDWRTGESQQVALPFALRLDDFHIESHDPVYRVFVFKHTGAKDDNASFEPVLSVAPGEQQGQRVKVDGRFAVRVDAYAPATEGDAAPRHTLQLGDEQVAVEPGRSYDVAGRHIKVGQFFPHFTYDISTKRAGNLSDRPVNPALQIQVRKGGADGEVEYQGWLFANMPGFSMAGHQDGTRNEAIPVYRHTGGSHASAPTVKLAVLEGEQQVDARELSTINGRHTLAFGDGKYVAVFRNRDSEAKNYYSKLSVIEGGVPVETRQIFVNEPFHYDGYAFYQANFDPRNLRYSGIEVVKDPGLWLVYAGLVLMLVGVLHIFYLRTLGRRRKESAA